MRLDTETMLGALPVSGPASMARQIVSFVRAEIAVDSCQRRPEHGVRRDHDRLPRV
jgi:hypothetical protein